MRPRYTFTPARRRALDAARKKRTFRMTRDKLAALRKATEANRRNFRLTPARLRAMSINARKMQRASVEKFRMTEARRQANARNIRKAQAAPRTPESRLRSRFNHLQHGLQARSLEETIERMGEDPKGFQEHVERFRRVFVPRGAAEEEVLRSIAEAVWRRLRLFHGQACWEGKLLKQIFERSPALSQLDLEETRARAHLLLIALTDRDRFFEYDQALIANVERELRMLLRLRSDGKASFGLYSRDSQKTWQRYARLRRELEAERRAVEEEEKRIGLLERLQEGGAEVEATIARVRAKMGWRP
ncbi:MAG: hypothetical protein HY508_07470 [Acidobacteria bacterium]|nr:hypothetical protein [Acidobacteriota bacterium]